MNEDNFPGLQGGTGGQQGGARDQHPDQEQRPGEQGNGVHVWLVEQVDCGEQDIRRGLIRIPVTSQFQTDNKC